MSITLPDLILHLCRLDFRAPENTWKTGLQKDLFQYIVGNYLPFSDIIATADVCRDWRIRTKENTTGFRLLNRAGLKATEEATWMKTYSVWLNSNYFIVIDKSASMTNSAPWVEEPWRMAAAMEKVQEICRHLEPVMKHKGISVTLYAKTNRSKTVRSIEELVSFVEERHNLGPTKSELDKALTVVAKKHQDFTAQTGLLSSVFVISDMGLKLSYEKLKSKGQKGLNFNLIKIGNDKFGVKLFKRLELGHREEQADQLKKIEALKLKDKKDIPLRRSSRIKAKPPSKRQVKREREDFEITFESIKKAKPVVNPEINVAG